MHDGIGITGDTFMTDPVREIVEALLHGRTNVVFTGAGISTESGISDFRSKGGIWDRYKPVYYDDFISSEAARIEYWRQKNELYREMKGARPNPAHAAITDLYRMGRIAAVITQNIDGLHQESGLPDSAVIELHGNTNRVRCIRCDAISSLPEACRRIDEGDLAPECSCGGYLKPDTISFGQAMPENELNRAIELASHCDVFLVVGSTLVVSPASLLPGYARRAGAYLAIINLSETPYDNVCDALVRQKAGAVLPDIVESIRKRK